MTKSITQKDDALFTELQHHYSWANDETDKRRTGRGRIGSISFDEADELFRSWLDESKWPYDALLFDPRVFTFIFEKTSRLLSNKLRGKLLPREGSDVMAAHINNELLNLQWDQASYGGTMLSKWTIMDLNTRKYGGAFGLAKWRYEKDPKGRVVFDGPEFKVLNNRDCLPDPAATNIQNANWFQAREYVTIQEMNRVNDASRTGSVYKNLKSLKFKLEQGEEGAGKGGDRRDTNWISRSRTISGLTDDPIGKDTVYKTVEIVTEYRRDKWITFAPKHGIILRDIPNPYDNYELPVVMLKYYPIDDDIYGMSEIEPVKGIQKAINALLSQYVDEINQNLNTPIAIAPGVREHTLHWGKGAKWRMNNPLTDFRLVESQSNAAQFFNNTYSALVAALQNAVGETSLGISSSRFNPEKTATEVNQVVDQRNSRDSFNQNNLAEALQRQMMLWHQMNQKMIFADEGKKNYVVRVVGKEAIDFFQNKGMDQMVPDMDVMDELIGNPQSDMVTPRNQVPVDAMVPKFPVTISEGEGEPVVMPKLSMDEDSGSGTVLMEPLDLKGNFDFIADVESMSLAGSDGVKQGRKTAITSILSSPIIIDLLAREKVKPKFKELFVAWLEDSGFKNAEKFFEQMQPEVPTDPIKGGVNTGKGQGKKLSEIERSSLGRPGQAMASLEGGPQPPQPNQINGI